jgi:PIN domain nuclease of toxin-antitoxin system
MIAGVADKHTALWYLFGDERLSDHAKLFIDTTALAQRKIAVSSISLAELVYLVEKQRLPSSAYDDLVAALGHPQHVFTEVAFTVAVVEAMRQVLRAEVPDMPDRIIAATAIYLNVPVISRDRRILSAKLKTIW